MLCICWNASFESAKCFKAVELILIVNELQPKLETHSCEGHILPYNIIDVQKRLRVGSQSPSSQMMRDLSEQKVSHPLSMSSSWSSRSFFSTSLFLLCSKMASFALVCFGPSEPGSPGLASGFPTNCYEPLTRVSTKLFRCERRLRLNERQCSTFNIIFQEGLGACQDLLVQKGLTQVI